MASAPGPRIVAMLLVTEFCTTPWARADALPYFLRDAFKFSELELLGQHVVLAIGRPEAKQALS
jgi:hypothetical protein